LLKIYLLKRFSFVKSLILKILLKKLLLSEVKDFLDRVWNSTEKYEIKFIILEGKEEILLPTFIESREQI